MGWKSILKDDPTGWLLEGDNPSVRFYTLRDIEGREENDPEVRNAHEEIMESALVKTILLSQ